MILVFAGNEQQARVYAREHHLIPSQWRSINEPQDLRGMRGARVVFFGTPHERKDYVEIVEAIKTYV